MKVYLSPLAEYKLIKLLGYLEEEWGSPSKNKFLKKLEEKFLQISSHPKSNPLTEDFDDVFLVCGYFPKLILLPNCLAGNRSDHNYRQSSEP